MGTEVGASSNDSGSRRNGVDWSKFGLQKSESSESTWTRDYGDYGTEGHQAQGPNELFAGERTDTPWWKSQFFISEPVLFGTIDGVFTSCLINVFGVIVFLRSGWIVGQAGILNGVLMVLAAVGIALITVLSAVGICERCRMESGGVYFLLAHVLGSRLGAAFGLLYVFGQAVGCSLYVLGLAESITGVLGVTAGSEWAQRGMASLVVLLLTVINLAGVKWVVKVQFMLLIVLLLAALDFAVGSFIVAPKDQFVGWWMGEFKKNLLPDYSVDTNWFTVFGVFFPTITGILAGINMSGDLRRPATDIPNGTLAALFTATGLYLMFMLILGSTCTREGLKTDFMIASKVSALSILLLAGLYVSSMSSCLGAMYGTPRVLQSIANENVIPFMNVLGKGRGPNKVPVYALAVIAGVTILFILVGNINSLAPVVTMPYLAMYAIIDYAYFALAQTFDLQSQREQRFRREAYGSSPTLQAGDGSNDLDSLFPERTHHRMYASIRPCSLYKDEYSDCTGIRARLHQLFVHGEFIDCSQWKRDYDSCLKWENSKNTKAGVELISSEVERRKERLAGHLANDVWEKRDGVPADWNKPLPQWLIDRETATYLNAKTMEDENSKSFWSACSIM